MRSPVTLPSTGTMRSGVFSVPESIWNSCFSVSSPGATFHVPATCAGMIHRSAVHHDSAQPSFAPRCAVSSAFHSPMVKLFETTRVPGLSARSFGRSFRLMSGSRNMVMTVALERSVSKRSAFMNAALSPTPACMALRLESSTMSGLYSIPTARAPRFAAVITVRPSPEPRSMRKSFGVSFAMSSILSTSTCGVGTQTTSFPGCPTSGSKVVVAVCAQAGAAMSATTMASVRAMVTASPEKKRNYGLMLRKGGIAMSTTAAVILAILVLAVVYAALLYNGLVEVKNNVARAWSNIDVLLKQRHDELPKLVEVCKQYSQFEKETLSRVTEARGRVAQAREAGDVAALGPAEAALRAGVGKIFATVEAYPELKANQNFMQLQSRITGLENAIADRREFYNDSVNVNNVRVEQVPQAFIARAFGFKEARLLEFDARETSDVDVGSLFGSKA